MTSPTDNEMVSRVALAARDMAEQKLAHVDEDFRGTCQAFRDKLRKRYQQELDAAIVAVGSLELTRETLDVVTERAEISVEA